MLDNTLSKVAYVADGIQKQWDIPFEFYKIEDVHIYITSDGEHIEEIDQNYYYDEEGKFFIYPTEESELDPIPAGTQVLILRETENTQLEDSSEIYFKSKDVERGLDNLTMQVQDLKRDSLRAVKLSHFATQTPEDFTKGIFEAEKRATEAAARAATSESNAYLSEQNAASNASSAQAASATATTAAQFAESLKSDTEEFATRAENAAADASISATQASESANMASDLLQEVSNSIYNKAQVDAKISDLQAEIDTVESSIPPVREEFNQGLSELQTQISAQSTAIAGKQDKLVAGANITINGNVISATGGGGGGGNAGSADIAKAIENQNTAIDTINPIYNWVGTKQEYEEQNIAGEHPDWICFITDDYVEPVVSVNGQTGEVVIDVPTKTSELANDSGFITAEDLPESGGASFPLFYHTFADHILNDASWLRGDTFSWQSGDMYVSAYNHLVSDLEGITAETETIGSTTITFYRAKDGHKIVLADQESKVSDIYRATGVAWYYILDTENKRFKLPRTKHAFAGLRTGAGNFVEAGLPNIKGVVGKYFQGSGTANESGAMYATDYLNAYGNDGSGNSAAYNLNLDASRSSSIYGNSDTVQPPSTEQYLYFYVGNTVRNQTEVDVGAVTERLNEKLDLNLNNFNPSQSFKDMTVGWIMPDYSTFTTIAASTNFEAPSAGVISFAPATNANTTASLDVGGSGYLSIAGKTLLQTTYVHGSDSGHPDGGLFPIDKGEIAYHTMTYGTVYFYPLKGV